MAWLETQDGTLLNLANAEVVERVGCTVRLLFATDSQLVGTYLSEEDAETVLRNISSHLSAQALLIKHYALRGEG